MSPYTLTIASGSNPASRAPCCGVKSLISPHWTAPSVSQSTLGTGPQNHSCQFGPQERAHQPHQTSRRFPPSASTALIQAPQLLTGTVDSPLASPLLETHPTMLTSQLPEGSCENTGWVTAQLCSAPPEASHLSQSRTHSLSVAGRTLPVSHPPALPPTPQPHSFL